MKLEINHRKTNGENTSMWKLNHILLGEKWINEEIKEEITKYL